MIRTRPLALPVALALLTGACSDTRDATPTAAQAEPAVSSPAEAALGATLLQGLGNYDFPVTSDHPEVQRWFNQALMLTYGFNHDAAERSFLQGHATRSRLRDVLVGRGAGAGPARQCGDGPGQQRQGLAAPADGGRTGAARRREREQAFIRALDARYAENPPEDRRRSTRPMPTPRGNWCAQRPDDLDAAAFHAEALMDLQPWDYYDAKLQPKGTYRRGRLDAGVGDASATPTTPARCTCTCTRWRPRPIRSAAWRPPTACAR